MRKDVVPSSCVDRLARNPCTIMADTDLASLLQSAESGNAEGREQLFTALYAELHRLAQRELRRNAGLTVSPTTLLHETFLNISQRNIETFADRGRFMAYAARAMRGLLIDYLRSRQAQKRGSQFEITSLPAELPPALDIDLDMAKLGDALDALAKIEPRLAECVDLKFFCGFSHADIAEMWSVSERTVQREWEKARILLHRFINDQPPS
ncbi:MAG TPA: ECF-type sigma factor [Steroidobacteraceae bacterium]|nr:ECF-type sigma factor [Steroidobacteraceae bacterium]